MRRLVVPMVMMTAWACSSGPGSGEGTSDAGPGQAGTSSSSGVVQSSSNVTGSSGPGSSSAPASSGTNPSSSAAATSSTSSSGGVIGTVTFTEHIRPILAQQCWGCHGNPQCFGAPFPLLTYASTQVQNGNGVAIDERILARVTAPNNMMPPSAPLSLSDQDLVRRWVESGSPEGPDLPGPPPPADCGTGTPDAGPPTIQVLAHAPGSSDAYSVPQDADENVYMCFGFTVPQGPPLHVTRFAPRLDNTGVVHHIVLYRDQGLDNNNPSTDPFGCGDSEGNLGVDWAFMYGWAPGTNGLTFPQDVGMPLNPGTRLVLQMHYHPVPGSQPLDQSGIDIFATDQLRPNEAGMIAVGPTGFSVTAEEPDAVATCGFPMSLGGFPVELEGPTRIFAAFPHMHEHGLSMRAEHIRGGTVLQTFGQVDNWSFDSQPNIPENVTMLNGDSIKVTCTYTNFDGNQTVYFGEKTEEEMCYEFLYTTPPIRAFGFDVPFCPL